MDQGNTDLTDRCTDIQLDSPYTRLYILLATVRLVRSQKAYSLVQNERILSECVFGNEKKQFTEFFEQSVLVDCTLGIYGEYASEIGRELG